MAELRMFAKTIIDSDAFLDMPLSAQSLYFHLSMRADDDGFINNPKKIQRMIGASDDDVKILVMKKFIIPFESGVVVIKHWKIHNYIQNDRYKATVYTEEKSRLSIKKNKAYTLDTECTQSGYSLDTQKTEEIEENVEKCTCIQNGYNLETQVRLELGKSKDRIELELGKDIDNKNITKKRDDDNNYFNKKNTGENSNHHHDHLCGFFVSSFGRQPTEKEIESLDRIYRTWDPDLCEEAIAKAVLNGQPNLGYVIGILSNWKKEGIRTYDDYAQRDIERRGI